MPGLGTDYKVWGDRRWRGNKRTPLPPSPPPPPPLSPLPKSPCPPRPLNSFPLKLREAWAKPFPTVTASTTPTPCSFGRSHLSLCRAQPGLLCPCRAPSLIPGACFCEWHHHPTPQAVQSSGQQLATSSRLHEATERHSPLPLRQTQWSLSKWVFHRQLEISLIKVELSICLLYSSRMNDTTQ